MRIDSPEIGQKPTVWGRLLVLPWCKHGRKKGFRHTLKQVKLRVARSRQTNAYFASDACWRPGLLACHNIACRRSDSELG